MSRNRQLTDKIRAALNAGNLTTSGISLSAITVHSGANTNSLLSADASGYADGSLHYSTNDKKLFVYDDSENKFYEVEVSANDIQYYDHRGSAYGYVIGGEQTGFGYSPSGANSLAQKYSFTSDANAVDLGTLGSSSYGSNQAQAQNKENSYQSGRGYGTLNILKFSLTSDAWVSDTAVQAAVATAYSASGNTNGINGYFTGGSTNPFNATHELVVIQKFAFASEGTMVDTNGDLAVGNRGGVGHNSQTEAFVAGGFNTKVLQKFPFAISSGTSVNLGYLSNTAEWRAGNQSDTHGYIAGGYGSNVIEKYPFATSDSTTTDVGDLVVVTRQASGTSSTTHGYVAGGGSPTQTGYMQRIQKYSYASDANATDVAILKSTNGFANSPMVEACV